MGYRSGAVFVSNWREHSRPMDRNARARIVFMAERLEVNTKRKGRRNGCLGYVGLTVLRALIFGYYNLGSGLCCPSYDALQLTTGLCRQSIANGVSRLESAGILRVVRRLCRQRVGGAVITTMATSLYSFWQPQSTLPTGTTYTVPSRSIPRRPVRANLPTRGGAMGLGELAILAMREVVTVR